MTAIVLTGMPGSGKSTVGRILADRIGARFHDLDALVTAADPAGRPAARILAEDGEPAFRAAEAEAVRALAAALAGGKQASGSEATRAGAWPGDRMAPSNPSKTHERPQPMIPGTTHDITAANVDAATFDAAGTSWKSGIAGIAHVVATGGWTLGDPDNHALLAGLGPIVCLTAPPAVLATHLAPTAGDRPLLPRPDASALAALLAARRAAYDAVPWQVATNGRTPEDVADQVVALLAAFTAPPPVAIPVATSEGPVGGLAGGYAVLVGHGLLGALGAVMSARGVGGRALVVSDANVGPLYGARTVASLERAGIAATLTTVLVGEAAKSPDVLQRLWDALAAARLERADTVVALGGGVVTDVAGLAAATWLRGVRLVNVPTSLLGMVDAAVGGKTGINVAAGKNLVGAFHPPALVVADVDMLATLPRAALGEGLAELVKAAVIDGEPMLADLEVWAAARGERASEAVVSPLGSGDRPNETLASGDDDRPGALDASARFDRDASAHLDHDASAHLDHDAWPDIAAWVARGVAVKARAVGGDLREARGGSREALNLGHTFAHGLEAASGYRLPHGQAVAIGLVAAARLAEDLGEAPAGLAARIETLLTRLDLPTRWQQGDVEAVLVAMARDKKRADGVMRFVLPRGPGKIIVRADVPETAVRGVLDGLRGR